MTGAFARFEADWRRLWEAAVTAALESDDDPRYVFEPIGLMLQPPGEPLDADYDATPLNAVDFASTGGDGVHFSAVPYAGGLVIVMTVPIMFDRPNVVVGADLMEFLALGCRHGYFGLEQLAYKPEAIAEALECGAADSSSGDRRQLEFLRERLSLQPWPDVRGRLQSLERLAASAVLPRRGVQAAGG